MKVFVSSLWLGHPVSITFHASLIAKQVILRDYLKKHNMRIVNM